MSFFNAATIRANKPRRNNIIVVGGLDASMSLDKYGLGWGWGYNRFGKITGTPGGSRILPTYLCGPTITFCTISFADNHGLGIDKNGTVWGWGLGSSGQVGNNSTASRLSPAAVVGATKTFCNISAGTSMSIAIDKNGRAWSWGTNGSGQLGDNSITQRNTPVSVLGAVKTFCKISAGLEYVSAIDKYGRAWGWGRNLFGEIGDNSIVSKRTPVSVLGAIKTFCEIKTSQNRHSLAIDKNGRVWAWGNNGSGELGDNSITSRLTPVSVLGAIKTFCKISAGLNCSFGIDKNGRAWAWGGNSVGQLGDNSTTSRLTPVSVLGAIKTFCEIATGSTHILAIDKNGRTWAWGRNIRGQLGIGYVHRCTPVSVVGTIKTFCKIFAGSQQSHGIDNYGRLWGWGINSNGRIGDNTSFNKCTPVSVVGAIKTFCQVRSMELSGLALDKYGMIWGWGTNASGQIGDNTATARFTPVSVVGSIKTFCQIGGRGQASVAIDKNGRAWAWGRNDFGQLGNNTITCQRTPVSVAGEIKTFCKIESGGGNTGTSLAIDKNGRLWSWGYNAAGNLGDNSTVSKRTPVSVLGAIKTFCEISVGSNQFCAAIDKYGKIWTWGSNSSFSLGNGNASNTSALTPVSIGGANKTFCKIGAGFGSVMAIDKYGQAWGWGYNVFANLGAGISTTFSVCTPVMLSGTKKTFCEISAGTQHSLGIDRYGIAWSWGNLNSGRLGSFEDDFVSTPVKVCNI